MVDFFTLLKPLLELYYKFKRKMLRINESKHWKKGIFPPKNRIKNITGSFIYQIPPDYPSVPAQKWKTQDWVNEFQRLKNLGFDTLIHNGAIAETTTGKWYIFYKIPEESLQKFKEIQSRRGSAPIINPCLDYVVEAAEQTEMNLHLGLFNVLDKWYTNPTPIFMNLTQNQEIITAKDLIYLYGDYKCIKGWYISPEISWLVHGLLKNLDMNNFLRPICKLLKSETPNKLIGISPITNYFRVMEGRIFKFWVNTLKNTGVDLIYPQDSVGALNETPAKSLKIWKLWKKIADASGMRLWANCETFERMTFKFPNPLYAAPYRRLIWQLESVTPFVEKIITWEAMYFINPNGAVGGKQLHNNYCDYFNYPK